MPRTATACTNRSMPARRGSSVGLQDSYHIGAVRVHPKNPDIVYVAALGHLFGPNDMRGVYRSHRRRRDLEAGADPRTRRRARSTSPWTRPTRVSSTPASGRCGATRITSTAAGRAAASSNRPTAATPGPTFRATRASEGRPRQDRRDRLARQPRARVGHRRGSRGRRLPLRQRRPHLDARSTSRRCCASGPGITPTSSPTRRPRIRCTRRTSGSSSRSTAAGRGIPIGTPHGDNHALWIAPDNPLRMIEGNDGGATVTNDGGRTWSIDHEPADRAVLPRRASTTISRTTSTARSRTTRPSGPRAGRPARDHRARLVRRRRRRERLDRARPARFEDRLCRFVRRPAHPAGRIAPASSATSTPGPTTRWATARRR